MNVFFWEEKEKRGGLKKEKMCHRVHDTSSEVRVTIQP